MKKAWESLKTDPLLPVAFLLFFAVYAGSLNNGFHRDDYPHIAGNAAIRDPSRLPRLFSGDYFAMAGSVAYRPVVTAARFAGYGLFGDDARGWRLAGLLLHSAAALLLLALLLGVGAAPGAAAAGAALFLLHPAHTEALNYVSNGQPDMFCLVLLLAASLAYLGGRTAAVWAFFLLALFSKEMALAFPPLLLLFEYSRGGLRRGWRLPALLAAAGALFTLWRLFFFRAGHGFLDNTNAAAAFAFSPDNFFRALAQFPALAAYYLKLLVWPSALSVEIDRLLPESGYFAAVSLALAWLAAIAGVWVLWKKRPWWALAAGFVLCLLPVSGLVPLTSRVQEHFVYIPSAFFCAMAGLWYAKGLNAGPRAKGFAVAAAILVMFSAAARTYLRNLDWRTPLALAEADLRSFTASPTAMVNLASLKKAAGDTLGARELCLEALKTGKAGAEAYFLLAELYLAEGLAEKAAGYARAGLAKDPGAADPWVNAAKVFARAGLLPEAESAAREAARRFPYFPAAFSTLGEVLRLRGRGAEAGAALAEAERLGGPVPAR